MEIQVFFALIIFVLLVVVSMCAVINITRPEE